MHLVLKFGLLHLWAPREHQLPTLTLHRRGFKNLLSFGLLANGFTHLSSPSPAHQEDL